MEIKDEGFINIHELNLDSFPSSTHYRVLIRLRGLEGLGEQILLHFEVKCHEPKR